NSDDLDGYLSMYHASVRLHGYSPEPLDISGVVSRYRAVWASLAMPGRKSPVLTIDEAFEAKDRVVCRFTMSGVQSGPFMNVAPSGKSYVMPGITILQFRDGQVVERWSCTDRLSQLVQIGAIQIPR